MIVWHDASVIDRMIDTSVREKTINAFIFMFMRTHYVSQYFHESNTSFRVAEDYSRFPWMK